MTRLASALEDGDTDVHSGECPGGTKFLPKTQLGSQQQTVFLLAPPSAHADLGLFQKERQQVPSALTGQPRFGGRRTSLREQL